MDEILSKASNQAMSFAIRSGISIASGFAIRTVSKFLDKIPVSEKARLEAAKSQLLTKITILSTSLDLIKLAAARGNSVLDSTVDLVTDLQAEIDRFDLRMNNIINDLSNLNEKESVKHVEKGITDLLASINEAVPLITLSLVTCGVNIESAMKPRISPGRFLQAAHHINVSNERFNSRLPTDTSECTVGPQFDLKLYSVFYNPSRLRYVDKEGESLANNDLAVTWKEDFARANCQIVRVSDPSFKYEIRITENFDDGRYHDDDDVPNEKRFGISLVRKLFFSASGKLLRLEGSDSPVLTLKLLTDSGYEYVALGEISADSAADDDEEDSDSEYEDAVRSQPPEMSHQLSLFEYLVRFAALQQNEQAPLMHVKDEKLALYLYDETDDSVIPKSRDQRKQDAVSNARKDHLLNVESSVKQFESLSLKENEPTTK